MGGCGGCNQMGCGGCNQMGCGGCNNQGGCGGNFGGGGGCNQAGCGGNAMGNGWGADDGRKFHGRTAESIRLAAEPTAVWNAAEPAAVRYAKQSVRYAETSTATEPVWNAAESIRGAATAARSEYATKPVPVPATFATSANATTTSADAARSGYAAAFVVLWRQRPPRGEPSSTVLVAKTEELAVFRRGWWRILLDMK